MNAIGSFVTLLLKALEAVVALLQGALAHPNEPASLLKDTLETIESAAKIAAIIIGGIWTYRAFVRSRGYQPRAALTHQISHRTLDDGRRLLVVDVLLENLGEVSIILREAETWVQQMVPLPPALDGKKDIVEDDRTEANWPYLDKIHKQDFPHNEYIIDPKERDQFRHNFIFGCEVKTIQVYTCLLPQRSGIGWKLKSTYDIEPGQPGSLNDSKQSVEAPGVEQKPATPSARETAPGPTSPKEGTRAESSQEGLDEGAS